MACCVCWYTRLHCVQQQCHRTKLEGKRLWTANRGIFKCLFILTDSSKIFEKSIYISKSQASWSCRSEPQGDGKMPACTEFLPRGYQTAEPAEQRICCLILLLTSVQTSFTTEKLSNCPFQTQLWSPWENCKSHFSVGEKFRKDFQRLTKTL